MIAKLLRLSIVNLVDYWKDGITDNADFGESGVLPPTVPESAGDKSCTKRASWLSNFVSNELYIQIALSPSRLERSIVYPLDCHQISSTK